MYDYMTITLTGGLMICVFECPDFKEHAKTYQFGLTHIPKEYVQKIEVSRRPGDSHVLLNVDSHRGEVANG